MARRAPVAPRSFSPIGVGWGTHSTTVEKPSDLNSYCSLNSNFPNASLVYQDTSFDFTFLHAWSKLSTSYPPGQEKVVDKPLFARGGFLL